MKLAQVDHPAERIGLVGAETNFTIKATAKAFRILSSSLYKDKIGAVLRELGANAHDAHIAAGCPEKPFDLHLPTELEPFLSVKDYGPGLSHDDVMQLYTTYFESTKTDSNDYVGALGLGSKSPFSYVRAFTVVSRHSGMETTYDAVIGADGLPTIAQRARYPMNSYDPTGLEVIVPVKSFADSREFASKAPAIFNYYPVRPTATGAEIVYSSQEIVISGDGYHLMSRNSSDARAIMGVVAYPISISGLYPNTTSAPDKIRRVLSSPVDIYFPMGSLDITAGREELSYDPETIATLLGRLETIYDEMVVLCDAEFKGCKTALDAHKKYGEFFDRNTPLARLMGDTYKAKFKGREISAKHFTLDLEAFKDVTFKHYKDSARGNVKYFDTHKWTETDMKRGVTQKLSIAPDSTLIRFLVVDQPGAWSRRIFDYRVHNRRQHIILVENASPKDLKAIKTLFDGFVFDGVSSLPSPKAVAKTRARLRKMSVLYYDHITIPNCHKLDAWPSTSVILEEGGVYVLTRHSKFQQNDLDSDENFSTAFTAARRIGLLDPHQTPIFAVPATESKAISASSDWVNIWDYLKEPVEQYVKANPDIADKVHALRGYRKFDERVVEFSKITALMRAVARKLDPEHPYRKFVDGMTSASEYNWGSTSVATKVNSMDKLTRVLGLGLGVPDKLEYDLLAQWKALHEAYPMLNFIPRPKRDSGWVTPSDPTLILDYIETMDSRPRRNRKKVTK